MLRLAYAFAALAFAATLPLPVAAQCFGPECERPRSGPPAYYDGRPPQQPNAGNFRQPGPPQFEQGRPLPPNVQGQPNFQRRPHPPTPYAQPNFQQGQPNFQQPQPGFQRAPNFQQSPNFQQAQPHFQQQPNFQQPPNFQPPNGRPGYQGQPRPPANYTGGPGMMPPPQNYRDARPDGREVRTRVTTTRIVNGKPVTTTRTSKAAKQAAYRPQPAPDSRQAVRRGPAASGAGQVTISVAEYRDLQNQARELQRMMGERGGAPRGANRRNVFPDAPPPGAGNPEGR